MVSNVAKTGGSSDFLEVVAWLKAIGYTDAQINGSVVAVDPGVRYSDDFVSGFGGGGTTGRPTTTGVFSLIEDADGPVGLPVDIDDIVETLNPIEGDYREAGFTDGAVDTNQGSVNGLAEYTSTILDDPANDIKMSGALWATTFSGSYLLIGRNADGIVETTTTGGRTVAADKVTINAGGGPLGIYAIGDDLSRFDGEAAFRGTVWTTIYKQNGPVIEIFQPGNPDTNPLLPVYAGQVPSDPTDHDLDGIDHINDPFDFSATNGYDLAAGQKIVLDFNLAPPNPDFSGSLGDTGLFGSHAGRRDAEPRREAFGRRPVRRRREPDPRRERARLADQDRAGRHRRGRGQHPARRDADRRQDRRLRQAVHRRHRNRQLDGLPAHGRARKRRSDHRPDLRRLARSRISCGWCSGTCSVTARSGSKSAWRWTMSTRCWRGSSIRPSPPR